MKEETGKIFFETTANIHNLMLDFDYAHKQAHKLGRVECNLLQHLLTEGRPLSMKEIAKYMNVSHSRITHLVDNLISKKYIERISCKNDRRVYYANITEEGKKIAYIFRQKSIKMYEKMISAIPEEEQKVIFEALENWMNFLKQMRKEVII
jgi:MarR family 2-MHQ and catechol resistance regulon transcriptional repressor